MATTKKKKKKKQKKSKAKHLIAFLLFQFIFSAVFMPVMVFYGPFENVKRTVVGASWGTLRHQFIAKFFLSEDAIKRVLENHFAVDPIQLGGKINKLKFGINHTDKIEVYNVEGDGFDGKMMVIYDPTKIQVGYSSQLPKCGEVTSQIAKRNQAVAAINAGGFMDDQWSSTGGTPMGYIIHNGEVVYNHSQNEKVKQDTAAFTEDGMLIVGMHSIEQLKEYKVKEGVSFGPPLVVNGKPTITEGDGGWGKAPRTAIGQRANGEVLFLVIDGRRFGSLGATLRQVQDILLQYGAVNAVNLDGGSSTTMFFNGSVINKPSDALGERAVPTAFMVIAGKEGAEE